MKLAVPILTAIVLDHATAAPVHYRSEAAGSSGSSYGLAAVPSLQPGNHEVVAETCFARTASGTLDRPVSFVALNSTSFRNASHGSTDFVLDHAAGMPHRSELHGAAADDDAAELFARLRALSQRQVVNLSDVTIITHPPEYGAGSTLHMLVIPTLESLIEGRTLFWPHLALWAPRTCAAKDLSCYFDALPSLSQYTIDWKHQVLRRQAVVEEQHIALRPSRRVRMFLGAGRDAQIADHQAKRYDRPRKKGHERHAEQHRSGGTGTFASFVQEDQQSPIEGATRESPTTTTKPEAEKEEEEETENSPQNLWMTKSDHPREHPIARQLHKMCKSDPSSPGPRLFNQQQTTSSCGVRTLDLDPGPIYEHYDEVALFARLPHRFLRHGRFWLISQVLHFLTRPNARLKAELDLKRAALRLRSPTLSLHIRKGDACSHRGDCRDLAYYMPKIERLKARYGIKSIFLSTPSPDVIEDTANYPHLHFAHAPTTPTTAILRAHKLKRIEEGLGLNLIDTGLEFRSYMVDIYLLAEGSVFLGAFTSNAARLAYSLMSAGTEGCLKPYESADINWCFGVCKGGPGVIRFDNHACEDDPVCDAGKKNRIAC